MDFAAVAIAMLLVRCYHGNLDFLQVILESYELFLQLSMQSWPLKSTFLGFLVFVCIKLKLIVL